MTLLAVFVLVLLVLLLGEIAEQRGALHWWEERSEDDGRSGNAGTRPVPQGSGPGNPPPTGGARNPR